MTPPEEKSPPALKEWFNEARYRSVAGQLAELHPGFDRKRFLSVSLEGLDRLSLLQRLRRMTVSTREALPLGYRESLAVLRNLAPRLDHSFVTLFLPDFVGLYGLEDFDESMEALRFFTRFGSSEFAVREFLRRDLRRTLKVMHEWSCDPDEHVRRLASEGCRPRLPWSFRLGELVADPRPAFPILGNLREDPSLYVRKSVANHLNDISRDHPGLLIDLLGEWNRGHPHTAWIAKRALRTLVKRGDRGALSLIGAGGVPRVEVDHFSAGPPAIRLGGMLSLSARIRSTGRRDQRLVIDYAIHYVKKSGATSAKVFKWAERDLAPGENLVLEKTQQIRDFTTRVHYPGDHAVDLLVNGVRLGGTSFRLGTGGKR